ncbi:MAG: response regulator receiver protein [Bacteroidetes bacterium]|nr:response regulator receiver protein [Bacteroidota bacterium]
MKTCIKSILLVDDDLDDQRFFEEALKLVDSSICLYTAKDGIDAIDQLIVRTPDIILLDLNMPRMNGVEFLQELKASNRFRDIPVVIYSSFLSTCDKVEVMGLGAKQFVRKPIAFGETVNTIRQLLEEHTAEFAAPMYSQPVGATQAVNLKY